MKPKSAFSATVSQHCPRFLLHGATSSMNPDGYSSHTFPAAFYYCYDHVKNLDLIVAEVNNAFLNRTMMG
jgi:hypothetical protein